MGDVDFSEMKSISDTRRVCIIDVRNAAELEDTGKIPGSINIPLDSVEEAVTMDDTGFRTRFGVDKPKPSDELVMSCRSGKRAQTAAAVLAQHGYTNTRCYRGSMEDWLTNGGPVERP